MAIRALSDGNDVAVMLDQMSRHLHSNRTFTIYLSMFSSFLEREKTCHTHLMLTNNSGWKEKLLILLIVKVIVATRGRRRRKKRKGENVSFTYDLENVFEHSSVVTGAVVFQYNRRLGFGSNNRSKKDVYNRRWRREQTRWCRRVCVCVRA